MKSYWDKTSHQDITYQQKRNNLNIFTDIKVSLPGLLCGAIEKGGQSSLGSSSTWKKFGICGHLKLEFC